MGVLLPQVTSLVAVGLIFAQLFSHDYGLVNYVLGLFGVGKINWEAGQISSWVAISAMVTWRWTGYNALIYLAAMQGIPEELYEAAAVDGAHRWRQFRHVTIPMLRPTIIFTVIVSTIGGMQLFTEPYIFQPNSTRGQSIGGSGRQYQTIVMYLYEKAFGSTQFKYGYASAVAWFLVLLIALFSLVNFLIVRRIRSAD
jgi:cellobiose transport system permease protein